MTQNATGNDRSFPRRALLAGLVGAPLLLTACGGGGAGPTSGSAPTTSEAPAPADRVRSRCAQAEADLIALYDAAIAQNPDLTTLVAIRAEHQAHLDAFASGVETPTGMPASTASIKDLQKAEQSAADARTDDCVAAGPDADLARLIALVAASEASHAIVLGGAM